VPIFFLRTGVRVLFGYRSNELGTVGDGGFADAPVDLTITSKAKIKNSNAAIHHIISYQRIVCCAVAFSPIEFSTFCMTR
jgi:hypothetical protein